MMNLVLDIETIPCDEKTREILPVIQVPANLKTQKLVSEWKKEKLPKLREDQYLCTALNPNYGRIFCIGMFFFEKEKNFYKAFSLYGNHEKEILADFWQRLKEANYPYIITYNGLGFDLPFIWKRSVILNVNNTREFNLRRYTTDYNYDIMAVWSNWDSRNSIKLNELTKILEVESKSGTGADVYDMWQGKKYKEIATYCLQDVYVTYLCYCRMNFLTPVTSSKIDVSYQDFFPSLGSS